MGMTFRKNFDFKKIADDQRRARKEILEREMEQAITEIVQRTQSGVDVDGRRFKPYSDGYEEGKRKKLGGPQQVDLTVTGRMLAAIRSKVEDRGGALVGRIFFSASQVVKARANQKLRRFFALSKEQLQKMTDALRKGK